eukprot:82768_1
MTELRIMAGQEKEACTVEWAGQEKYHDDPDAVRGNVYSKREKKCYQDFIEAWEEKGCGTMFTEGKFMKVFRQYKPKTWAMNGYSINHHQLYHARLSSKLKTRIFFTIEGGGKTMKIWQMQKGRHDFHRRKKGNFANAKSIDYNNLLDEQDAFYSLNDHAPENYLDNQNSNYFSWDYNNKNNQQNVYSLQNVEMVSLVAILSALTIIMSLILLCCIMAICFIWFKARARSKNATYQNSDEQTDGIAHV